MVTKQFKDEVKSFNFKMEFNNYEWFYDNYLRNLNGFYNITLLRTYDAHFKVRFPRPKERAITLNLLYVRTMSLVEDKLFARRIRKKNE